MKIIESLGGPLIGLDQVNKHLWSGTDGKIFVGDDSPFANDYEAAGDLTGGVSHPPCSTAKIDGAVCHGILISMPLETAIVSANEDSVCIAQVEYSDPEWNFSRLNTNDFAVATFDSKKDVYFSSEACTYVFFDAAFPGAEIEDEFISFELNKGVHIFSTAFYSPDESTGLILYKISRI